MPFHWIPNPSVSALHAAEMVAKFPTQVVDVRISESLVDFVQRIDQSLATRSIDPESFWKTLITCAAEIGPNHELARTTLTKLGRESDSTFVTTLAGAVTDIEAIFLQHYPKYVEQVALRIRPLQEHWLGYGSGLMAHVGRLTDKSIIPSDARIIPVQPVMGGFGWAHIECNIVRIEAMLTNPMAELPEIVRLGWLVSQLQLELPRFSELIGRKALNRIAPFAMLMPALAASQVLELSQCSDEIVALAISNWHIPLPVDWDVHDELVPTLLDWWETYLTTKPEWHIAMQALAKMLGVVANG